MSTTAAQMVAHASTLIGQVSPHEAAGELDRGTAVLLDVRVTQNENCFPMIPAGAAARDMVG